MQRRGPDPVGPSDTSGFQLRSQTLIEKLGSRFCSTPTSEPTLTSAFDDELWAASEKIGHRMFYTLVLLIIQCHGPDDTKRGSFFNSVKLEVCQQVNTRLIDRLIPS